MRGGARGVVSREVVYLRSGAKRPEVHCAPALGLSFMPRVICAFPKQHGQATISLVV